VNGSELPPLRPLAPEPAALSDLDSVSVDASVAVAVQPALVAEPEDVSLLWGRCAEAEIVEARLKSFCRESELVYAAVVDEEGAVEFSVCTVGSRPHNEAQIGNLVRKAFLIAAALGDEVGEREPQGLQLQGARWSYSLDPICDGARVLFGIFSSKALPAIVRAGAQKTRAALDEALMGKK
jgi:hypothetical protein